MARGSEEPSDLWEDLGSANTIRAYKAIGRLATDEPVAIALFNKHLHPVPVSTSEQFAALLKNLDSPTFEVRENAAKKLESFREGARSFLEEVSRRRDISPEVRRQTKSLLERLQPKSAECLREIRAVQALEYLGTSEAARVLRRLASGNPDARLTQEAKAAVERLAKWPARDR